jgi:hypothetical protein
VGSKEKSKNNREEIESTGGKKIFPGDRFSLADLIFANNFDTADF